MIATQSADELRLPPSPSGLLLDGVPTLLLWVAVPSVVAAAGGVPLPLRLVCCCVAVGLVLAMSPLFLCPTAILDARGVRLRRTFRSSFVPWSEIARIEMRWWQSSRLGTGYGMTLVTQPGRSNHAARLLLRSAAFNSVGLFLSQQKIDVRLHLVDARSEPSPAWNELSGNVDPIESIRTVRVAVVAGTRIRVRVTESGFLATVDTLDGARLLREGPIRSDLAGATADAEQFVREAGAKQ